MVPEKKEYDVTVLRRQEVKTYPKIGIEAKNMLVTYVAAGLAPATLTFPLQEYSEKKEKEQIRKHILERLQQKPETIKV